MYTIADSATEEAEGGVLVPEVDIHRGGLEGLDRFRGDGKKVARLSYKREMAKQAVTL